jgi:acetyltransferase-like isoleucine patch superfamily enzyme
MNYFNIIASYLETFFAKKKINVFLTVYSNFRLLPFNQAIKLPIYVYGSFTLKLRGTVVINGPLHRGMIKIGNDLAGYVIANRGKLTITKDAKIIFNGNANICQGSSILVNKNGVLILGNNVNIGDNVKIICFVCIEIGDKTGVTWESQITDYNFHFIENLNSNQIYTIYKSIKIGKYCWIGNRSSIMPGTTLPDRTIVASNSLLNKDYVKDGVEFYSLLGGIPAKLIKKGVKRIYNIDNEIHLQNLFYKDKVNSFYSSMLPEDE